MKVVKKEFHDCAEQLYKYTSLPPQNIYIKSLSSTHKSVDVLFTTLSTRRDAVKPTCE